MASQVFKGSVWYWDRRSEEGKEVEEASSSSRNADEEVLPPQRNQRADPRVHRTGVVVILAWMLSTRKHLTPYTRLYKSIGWDCLVCHSHFLNLFFPSMASTLALSILLELVKDIETHSGPVVFVTFSGGHKACLYKIIQILLGQCSEVKCDEGRFKVVVRSVVGLIFDSSPMDFESEIGAKVVSQQMLTFRPGRSSALLSKGALALGRGLDIVFAKELGLQKVQLWHALYSSVNMGPILILCSDNDELSPLETIDIYSSNVRKLGGDVRVIVWKESKHVGHFRHYPEQYKAEVENLLANASSRYADQLLKQTRTMHMGNLGGQVTGTIDTSDTTWTDLPEHVIIEINRMSRLPHLLSKGGDKDEPASRSKL